MLWSGSMTKHDRGSVPLISAEEFVQIARARSGSAWEVVSTEYGDYVTDGQKRYPLPVSGKGRLAAGVVGSMVGYFGLEEWRLDFHLDPTDDY